MKQKKLPLLLMLAMFFCGSLQAQTLRGTLQYGAGQNIKLLGFNGLKAYTIDSTTIDTSNTFKLTYTAKDHGMGLLTSAQGKPLVVLLNHQDMVIRGIDPFLITEYRVLEGRANQLFQQYANEQPRREQVLNVWAHLQKVYGQDSLFLPQQQVQQQIAAEQTRLMQESETYLEALPDHYLKWYLPVRQLVSSVQSVAMYRTQEIGPAIAAFRSMDYSDQRLWKSGLLKETIEGHFWLLENSGQPLDSVYAAMKISIDRMLETLYADPEKFNAVTEHLFGFLEERSLFTASEYLALKVLSEQMCTVDSDLEKQLESYRKMKNGNVAADIVFGANTYYPDHIKPGRLSEMDAAYTLVVFAAGWCPNCREDMPKIAELYPKMRSKQAEVLLVSLDETPAAFAKFAASLPFISTCDFQKWEGEAVQEYHVFGTPTMYLLDKELNILVRIKSVAHLEAWVDQKM